MTVGLAAWTFSELVVIYHRTGSAATTPSTDRGKRRVFAIPGESLIIEITEDLPLDNIDRTLNVLEGFESATFTLPSTISAAATRH